MFSLKTIFGVTTSKYSTNFIPDITKSKTTIIIPLGCCIVKWNIQTQKRLFIKQLHESIIIYLNWKMIKNNKAKMMMIMSCSNEGEIGFWINKVDKDDEIEMIENVFKYKLLNFAKVYHLHWNKNGNGDQIVGCCDYEKEKSSILFVVDVLFEKRTCQMISKIEGDYYYSCFCSNNQKRIFAIVQDDENFKNGCVMYWFDEKFNVLKKKMLSNDQIVSAFETNEINSHVALSMSDKTTYLVNLNNFEIKEIKHNDGGRVYCMRFKNNNELYLAANNSGKITKYNIKNESMKYISIPKQNVFWFGVSKDQENDDVWLCDAEKLRLVSSVDKKVYTLSYIKLTGCGIAFSDKIDESLIITGDLSGNVFLWDYEKFHVPIKQINVGISVRAICIKPNSSNVQIGCFDGSIYDWDYKNDKNTRIAATTEGIMCMKWQKDYQNKNNNNGNLLFAAGTSGGDLLVFQSNKNEDFLRIKLSIKAHKPWWRSTGRRQDERFGSISIRAEIWSISFSPNNDYIATSSEDQTTCIWDINSGEKVHLLSGHSAAVTSVQWVNRNDRNLSEIICTASDDKKLMVWKNNAKNTQDKTKWYIYHIFSSLNEGLYWHTLTYIEIYQSKDLIIAVSQNGYILIFCLSKKELIYKNKIHMGSIEGLIKHPKKDLFASISSDCSCNIFQIHHHPHQKQDKDKHIPIIINNNDNQNDDKKEKLDQQELLFQCNYSF